MNFSGYDKHTEPETDSDGDVRWHDPQIGRAWLHGILRERNPPR